MSLSLIVAMSRNRVIGNQGDLPWRMAADLRRFKQITMGHSLIMGRKTLDSIGRLLPGRTTIVLTRNPNYQFPGARMAHDWEQAVRMAGTDDESFVCGGAEIYHMALPHVDRIYLTLVATEMEGDAYFPPWNPSEWRTVEESHFPADDKNAFPHCFQILQRKHAT